MGVLGFDHVAVPIERTAEMMAFYGRLGFETREAPPNLYSVHFGRQKINMHGPALWKSGRFSLRGPTAVPGCGDFCFVWSGTTAEVLALLEQAGAPLVEGPVAREGGRNVQGESVYTRDPDGNLLEFIVYPEATPAG